MIGDSASLNVAHELVRGVNDEEILARFVKGFFGGFIILPERFMLRAGLWRILPVRFSGEL